MNDCDAGECKHWTGVGEGPPTEGTPERRPEEQGQASGGTKGWVVTHLMLERAEHTGVRPEQRRGSGGEEAWMGWAEPVGPLAGEGLALGPSLRTLGPPLG